MFGFSRREREAARRREQIERQELYAQLRSALAGTGYVPAAPVLSGTYVTPETGITVAPLFAAVNVISTDIATLPRKLYRRLPDGGRIVEEEIPQLATIHDLIHVQPNEDMDSFRWMQTSMSHVLTRGNSYSQIVREDGWPVDLVPLNPSKTVPKRAEGSDRLYYETEDGNKLKPEDVLHFAGMGFDGVQGYSPITVCRQTVGLTIAVEQYGASFFGNGARVSGFIKLAKTLTELAKGNLRGSFNRVHQGTQNAHQIGFLEEGMDWVSANFSPNDGQFLETRQFQVLDIARLYRIPPHKLGDYSESHLASVEEANLDYVAMTLLGWVSMVEAQMNLKLLTREQRRTHVIALDMSALLRGNIAARTARYQTLRNAGAINADEIRLGEGMNPLPKGMGGDKYLVQGQYVPLDQVGNAPLISPAPASSKEPSSDQDSQSDQSDPETAPLAKAA